MALITCPECRKKISNRATSCPSCGCPISVASANKKSATKKTDSEGNDCVKKPLGFFDTVAGFAINEKIICPHCHKRGSVATKSFKEEKGISGAKAVGAILTDGWSLPFTGLSQKTLVTEARCKNCGSKWRF